MARARTRYDHSNCCLNCSCIGSGILRDIVRDGYGIEGSCEMLKCFCPPCNAIQVNAEVTKRGPKVTNQTKQAAQWSHGLCDCCSDGCGSCCFACCCLSCSWAQARTRYDRSSCCLNFCCLGSAATRNIIREGYGIDGTCVGDVCVAACCPCCAAIQANAETTARRDRNNQLLLSAANARTPQILYVQQLPQSQPVQARQGQQGQAGMGQQVVHIQQPQQAKEANEGFVESV